MNKQKAIEFKKVSYQIDGIKILDNINFTVQKGDFITMLGANGAGKSTILKTIMGFNKGISGSVLINDMPVKWAGKYSAGKKTGYMPQSFDVDKYFPVLVKDVLEMGGKKIDKKVIKEFGLEKIMRNPFGAISGGEKQKTMLAMVLSRNPEILLLDEPNLNLDFFACKKFIKLIEKIYRERGVTIMYITHFINHIPEASSKVLAVKKGKIIFKGNKKNIFKKKKFMEFIYD